VPAERRLLDDAESRAKHLRFQLLAMRKVKTISRSQPIPSSAFLEVRASGVHGRGVYATRFIAEGTRIIEYTGERKRWESVPDDANDPRTYLFGLQNGIDVIDPAKGGNEARWINHSCDPNCEAIEKKERVFIYALRDLQPGEELFYDYQLEIDGPRNAEAEKESECHCGSANCRGTMLDPV
jgi:SET domain-containing protein